MRTQFMANLIVVTSLLVGGQALAQPAQTEISDFQPGHVLRARELNAIVRQLNLNTNALSRESGTTYTVNCPSETIADALSKAQPGDTISITGMCNETVEVKKDGITLDGGDTAIIDGGGADAPVIGVYGQQNVVIRGLTVQKGQHGVMADRGAAVWLEDVTAQDNGGGIAIRGNSSATFAGTIRGNDNDLESGIEVRQSTLFAENVTLVQTNGNAEGGILVHRGSQVQMVFTGASEFEVKNNGGFTGLLCSYHCNVNIISIGNLAGGLKVTSNDGVGIWVSNHSEFVLEGVHLTVSENKNDGLSLSIFSTAEIYGGFSFGAVTVPTGSAAISKNGGNGISLQRSSSAAIFSGGITISSNGGKGISAWNGVDVNLYDATFTGNTGEDIDISLASRLGWGGNTTVDTVSCDDSVLTYNDAACPSTVPDDSDQ